MKWILMLFITVILACSNETQPPVIKTNIKSGEMISTVKIRYHTGKLDTVIIYHTSELTLSFDYLEEKNRDGNNFARDVSSFSVIDRKYK